MQRSLREHINSGIYRLLIPVAKLCMRYAVSYQEFEVLSKRAFITAARECVEASESKLNSSRISAKTGIHRRDIKRLEQELQEAQLPSLGVPSRVIALWLNHEDFRTKAGKPRVLSCKGDESEFHQLVRRISDSNSPRSLLEHFRESGLVEVSGEKVRLIEAGYSARADPDQAYRFLQHDVEDLVFAVDENIQELHSVPNLHSTTESTGIPVEALPELREWLLQEGAKLHERLRRRLGQLDVTLERNSTTTKPVARVVVGTFSRITVQEKEKE